MAGNVEKFKALSPVAKLVVVAISAVIAFVVYLVAQGFVDASKHDRAIDACKSAVKAKIHNQSASFGEPYATDAAQGRVSVTGSVSAGTVSVTYDCLVDGDGSNAEVDILP